MKTCKDCLHCEICPWNDGCAGSDNCIHFTDISEYLHLPCKAGDTVYYPWKYNGSCGIAINEIESIKIYANNKPLFIVKNWESDVCIPITFTHEDFGQIIFTDYKKAENALKEIEE